ncbi:MAG: NADPH:quinone oxidoreductase family protein [Alphaproteobacteria bacterium]|nr:NADPH:quinone oxidoreductase family protein [Alphaproteobacteria bacterium]
MRAAVCKALNGVDGLTVEDFPAPAMIEKGVRVRVHAAALNFADTLAMKGSYQVKIEPPFVPGAEAAGEVVEVAPGVTGVKPGDRVMAHLGHGAFAEEIVAPEDCVYPIPAGMDFVTAAGFPIVYGTSYIGLTDRARLRAGEVLVVHGAAGGVGLSAVEIGKKIGATVIATAGGADKLAIAKAHGADHLIDYRTEDVRARVKALTHGRGADVVYDPVGGKVFESSLRSTAPDGRILVVGFASGEVPPIPANILLVKNITVIGYYWGAYQTIRPEIFRAQFQALFQWWREGALKPHASHVLPLERIGEAFALLQGRKSSGKVVLAIRP